MLRLYTEEERNDRAFLALTRFLEALDVREPQPGRRPALDPLVLSFQLKLLWLSGFLPHLGSCVECGAEEVSSRSSPRREARCAPPATGRDRALAGGARGLVALLGSRSRRAGPRHRRPGGRDVLAVVTRPTSTTAASACGRCRE